MNFFLVKLTGNEPRTAAYVLSEVGSAETSSVRCADLRRLRLRKGTATTKKATIDDKIFEEE